ncbi:hypothetical protein KEM54_006853 [Ascosphaera aggregata]|nr:hypothetical protein KEM54_006853 [Ascosphaera aggregata]
MPKVIEYAPPWLSRPSPGFSFFTQKKDSKKDPKLSLSLDEEPYVGPRRTIARRGREVFAVVGNQLRWAELAVLKDKWQEIVKAKREAKQDSAEKGASRRKKAEKEGTRKAENDVSYIVLNPNVYGEITQLAISPDGVFMAIVTRHTIHVSVLPDPSHLSSGDTTPLKVKTFQLGPTVHVRPQSPVIAALWHPLGVYDNHGGCLVTVTQDAIVRLWEINKNDHWSFDKPTIAVDLKRLIDATSSDEDLTPSGFGRSKGFSADSFEMEVASACFGGSGFAEEDPWSPFTLWVAMRPGFVHALCPLLPSKWQVPSLTLPTLSNTILVGLADVEDDFSQEKEDFHLKQHRWLSEIDSQEPLPLPETCQWKIGAEIRLRPDGFSAIPRMQGPFYVESGNSDDLDVTDIMVIPAKTDFDNILETGDELAGDIEDGPPVTMIVLATRSGVVHTCLELQGVGASWLPKHTGFSFGQDYATPIQLLPLETLETAREQAKRDFAWPLLTQGVQSRYSFFVTNACNVTYVSFRNWAERAAKELQDPTRSGALFRLKIRCDGDLAERETIAKSTEPGFSCSSPVEHLPACLVLYDYDLGYLLLTHSVLRAHAAILDCPSFIFDISKADDPDAEEHRQIKAPLRSPYQAPSIFYSADPLADFLEVHAPRDHAFLKEEVTLSAATLDVIVAAHGILSTHTSTLERAASGLFVRAQRLSIEMRDQLAHLTEISNRIIGVNDKIGPGLDESGNSIQPFDESDDSLTARVVKAKKRQEEFQERYSRIKSNILKAGGKPLSLKEKTWIHEVETLSQSLNFSDQGKSRILERIEKAKITARQLINETKRFEKLQDSSAKSARPSGKGQQEVTQGHRRQVVMEALQMIDKE